MGRPLKVWRRAGHSGIDHTAAGPSCRGLGDGRGGGGVWRERRSRGMYRRPCWIHRGDTLIAAFSGVSRPSPPGSLVTGGVGGWRGIDSFT